MKKTTSMGFLNVKISDDLDKKFRDVVYKRKGLRRGDIQEAVIEALELWIQKK